MIKTFKLPFKKFWDSTGIMHNRRKLSDVLENKVDKEVLNYSNRVEQEVGEWLPDQKKYTKIIGAICNEGENRIHVPGLRKLVEFHGICFLHNQTIQRPFPYYSMTEDKGFYIASIENDYITFVSSWGRESF